MSGAGDEHAVVGVRTERATERGVQAELAAALQLAAAGRLRCSEKARRLFTATIRVLGEVLTGGDFYDDEQLRAFAWLLQLQAGDLAELCGDHLELTVRGRKAPSGPVHEMVGHLWRRCGPALLQ
ncbi:hypothetical protein OG894_44075 (plasmid) [Streptomyces sp. NBC_01724]|uniref:hypothetical protein n=1 Tax=Streptomyces sp. NBC_01724 TaxID=2975922 RepID=UPI002E3073B4|nr:hypothetical protein [Streptomyces sp. NBC_01724]